MTVMERLAGAPISWGVCEVPGWGIELAPRRVLGEMRELGLTATELGSDGYLPTDPAQLKDLCSEFGITMIGGFVPLVVHQAHELDATIQAAHRAAALMSPPVAPCSSPRRWPTGPGVREPHLATSGRSPPTRSPASTGSSASTA